MHLIFSPGLKLALLNIYTLGFLIMVISPLHFCGHFSFTLVTLAFLLLRTGFFVTIWIAAVMFKSNDILRKQTALKVQQYVDLYFKFFLAGFSFLG